MSGKMCIFAASKETEKSNRMKRLIRLSAVCTTFLCTILFWLSAGTLAAQTDDMHPWYRQPWTVIRDTSYDGYMFNKPFDLSDSEIGWARYCHDDTTSNILVGCRYHAETPVQIYGVATTFNGGNREVLLSFGLTFGSTLWAMILQKDGNEYIVIDSVKFHNYLRIAKEHPNSDYYYYAPDALFHLSLNGNNRLTYLLEFYFENPVTVEDTFYVGIMHYPVVENVDFDGMGTDGIIKDQDASHVFDELLVLRNMEDSYIPCIVGHNERLLNPNLAIFPIIKPYEEDSVFCDTVPGFHLAGMRVGYPTFAWDTDFCREEDLFEVQFAPYRSNYWVTVTTADSSIEVYSVFDPDIYYQARIRARRHHLCPIHDTVMWGPWCDPILFYTGSTAPDTTTAITPVEGCPDRFFTLSPNPATGTVRVTLGHTPQSLRDSSPNLGEQLALTLTDAAGREVLRRALPAGTDSMELDLSGLAAGTYYVTLTTPAATGTQRLVVR